LTGRKDCDKMRKDDRRSVDDAKEVKEVARIVKEHDVRRNEILNVAQHLFYTQGYERTSIQGIIDDIGIAKGTFYHYFGSKQELLDAIIGRMLDQTMQLVGPIVDDDQLNALEKFEKLFSDAHSWKLENKAFLLVISRILYKDENAIVRHKMKVASVRSITPLLAKIIRQGVEEGSFSTDDPDDMGEIVLEIMESLGETVTQMLLKSERDGDALDLIERKTATYEHAIERILGAPKGSLKLFDINKIERWFD